MTAGEHDRGLGRGRALGHEIVNLWPEDTGWWLKCECGEGFRARQERTVLDRWYAHVDEEIENRENRGV